MKNFGVIVLAAGTSTRFGGPKMLLELPNSKTLIRYVVDIVLDTGLSPVVVVLGRDADRVKSEIEALPVKVLYNPEYEEGMSTSLQVGISAIQGECDACLVVLGDQPFITKQLLNRLIRKFSESDHQIVYPVVRGRQINPVILDKSTFDTMQKLEGDIGARKYFSLFATQGMEWSDEKLLLDIDTEEDYKTAWTLMLASSSGTEVIPGYPQSDIG